ncbi:MAG: transporter, partial [Cryobacterium sp.]|nr:transporter [Cryobacterium sp.]
MDLPEKPQRIGPPARPERAGRQLSRMFRSLRLVNYRLWFFGALVSNTGFWMQRAAQDWIVLTELTSYDAAALGLTIALQTVPRVALLPWSGLISDRLDRRTVLLTTNTTMGFLALGLGIFVVSGVVELWHVYAFALAGGIITSIDDPAKHGFVSELVAEAGLGNAVALNAASFNSARTIGPAVAAGLVLLVGPGWVFMINAVTFLALIAALLRMRRDELQPAPVVERARGNLAGGIRYVAGRPDIQIVLVIVFLIGAFGLNFPIFTSTMTTIGFGLGVGEFGLLL